MADDNVSADEQAQCHSPPPWGHRSPGSWVQVGARRPARLMPQARRRVEPRGLRQEAEAPPG
jgi:hypothetical protein